MLFKKLIENNNLLLSISKEIYALVYQIYQYFTLFVRFIYIIWNKGDRLFKIFQQSFLTRLNLTVVVITQYLRENSLNN